MSTSIKHILVDEIELQRFEYTPDEGGTLKAIASCRFSIGDDSTNHESSLLSATDISPDDVGEVMKKMRSKFEALAEDYNADAPADVTIRIKLDVEKVSIEG